jgi:cell division protein FtsA
MSAKGRPAVGLDLGSSTTRVAMCVVEGDYIRYAGHGEAPSHLAWTRGRLTDQVALASSIRAAIEEAEARSSIPAEAAVIGIGCGAKGVNIRGVYEVGRKRQIDMDDLRCAVALATRVQLEDDRLVLQVCPQDFTLDGRAGFRNPQSISCSRLEANVHVVTASAQEHQGLVAAVHQAHLSVEESIFEGIAAAYATVVTEERARGVAVVDIGAESTHLAIYSGEALIQAMTIAIGGEHFTRDLASELKINYGDAERLKHEYGSANPERIGLNTLIDLPAPGGRAPRETRRHDLVAILEARAEQLLGLVFDEIQKQRMESNLFEGIVLTGGGALLADLCDVADRITGLQVRKGFARGIEGWPAELDTPVWAATAGLAMYSGRLKAKKEFKRGAPALAKLVVH